MFETSDEPGSEASDGSSGGSGGGCDPAAAGDPGLSLPISAARAGTDLELFELDLSGLSTAELLQLQRDEETHLRRHSVIGHRLITEFTSRGVGFDLGAKSTAGLLVQLLRINPREATARVRAAELLGTRRALSGQVLPPVFAATAAAQTAGSISLGHARLITDTVLALPDAVAAEHDLAVEATLLEHAATHTPAVLAGLAKRILDNLDPDGRKPTDEDHTRRRGLTLTTNQDGSGYLKGHLTPECLAITRAWLDSLAAPAPAEDGTPDPRPATQRTHDALQAAGQRLLTDDSLPPCGGVPTTLLITLTATDQPSTGPDETTTASTGTSGSDADGDAGAAGVSVAGSSTADASVVVCGGYASTAHGDLITVETAMRLADQADVITVRLNAHGGIASYGRSRRAATTSQRLALAARDRGCSFPGCTAPPGWTQAHHIRAWQHGGPTDLNNLTLVCGHHHRNYEKLGWTCQITNGTPYWTPPAWIDRHQTPRRNQLHHPELNHPEPPDPGGSAMPGDDPSPD